MTKDDITTSMAIEFVSVFNVSLLTSEKSSTC